LDKQASAWIAENHAGGSEWTKWGEGQDTALGALTAMLDYARGVCGIMTSGEKHRPGSTR
jgi:hypothetical protein